MSIAEQKKQQKQKEQKLEELLTLLDDKALRTSNTLESNKKMDYFFKISMPDEKAKIISGAVMPGHRAPAYR